jgi:hypothetical protein
MKRSTLSIIILIFSLISCKKSINSDANQIEPKQAEFNILYKLQENISILGNPSSFTHMEDGRMVISDLNSPKIIIYDKEGNPIHIIEKIRNMNDE